MEHILITPAQCRMARSLLNWTQTQLAEQCNLAPMTITKFEKEDADKRPEARTLEKIRNAFEGNGVEFIEGGGVRPRQSRINIFRGQEGFKSFFDDVYDIARTEVKPDICLTNVNEAEYDRWLASYEPVHARRMAQLDKVKLRVLMKEQDTHLTSTAYCEYRWVPKEQFADVSLYIYGSKVAFIEFLEADVTVTIVDNEAVTEAIRKMFELAWSTASTEPDA